MRKTLMRTWSSHSSIRAGWHFCNKSRTKNCSFFLPQRATCFHLALDSLGRSRRYGWPRGRALAVNIAWFITSYLARVVVESQIGLLHMWQTKVFIQWTIWFRHFFLRASYWLFGRCLTRCQGSRFALAKDVMVEIVSWPCLLLFGAPSKQGKPRTNWKFTADLVTNDSRSLQNLKCLLKQTTGNFLIVNFHWVLSNSKW